MTNVRARAAERRNMKARDNAVADEVLCELAMLRDLWQPIRGPHEGYALLLERMDVLWHEVKCYRGSVDVNGVLRLRMRRAAVLVAALAIQFATDCCSEER